MLLTLYGQYGSVKTTLSPDDTSTQNKEVQGDNVLSLSFTLYEFVSIDVNDYVDFEGERYWAVEKYLPNEKSTVEWEYNVKLYGIESLIKRFLVLNNTDGEYEAVFTLTAQPIEHMRLIVKNINDGMNTSDWKVGTVEGTGNVVIDYTGKYCDEALRELAEKVGVEWWIEGETVNLCRCEHGEELTLAYGAGLTNLDRDVADNAKFYTRLFPIGSSRNIAPERYGASRLQLPGGVKYVDVNTDRYGIIHHYEQDAFSGIYPRRIGVVSSVRSENVTDGDGKPYTIYYFKDDSLTFDPNDYEIGGLVKHVSFQEGSELAGLGMDDDHYFEVNYHSETREFEIITIWPYDDDTQLPGGTLVPKVNDRYILWNIRMPDEYYGLAEREFQSAVNEYNAKHALDVSRYKAPTDHVWIEDEGVNLYIGRKIRLESQEYFPDTGFRTSRITRISRRVTLPSQMDLEISDALATRTLEKIDDAIRDVRSYAGTLLGSINVPDIIKSWETTPPTDNNLLSARRSSYEFLSKKTADTAQDRITFLQGVEYGTFREGVQGGSVWRDKEGAWHFEADYVSVRRKLEAREVDIQEVRHTGGQLLLTSANLLVEQVEELDGGWRLWFAAKDGEGRAVENLWAVGDQAFMQTFNLTQQADGRLGNRFFWRLVKGVGTNGDNHYIDIGAGDAAPGSDAPIAGDRVIQLGHRAADTARQSAIIIAGAGTGAPSIDEYAGITSYSLEGCLESRMRPGDNLFTGRFTVQAGSTGIGGFIDLPEEVNAAVKVGAENLLRNTGFTGDRESVELSGDSDVTAGTATYSPTLEHWEASPSTCAVEVSESESGRGAILGTQLSQRVRLEEGKPYRVSLRVRQTGSGSLHVACDTLAAEVVSFGERVELGFTATTKDATFLLSARGHTVYDVKLERGTQATDWCPARLDTDPAADRFRALWSLQQALQDGGTEVLGGLVLSSLINLGRWQSGRLMSVTAGMSGVMEDEDDVAFWGGGTLEQAVRAVTLAKENELREWSSEDLAQVAKVVFTHGGRGILTDVVLRGYVYALGGKFRGAVEAEEGYFRGFVRRRALRINASNWRALGIPNTAGGGSWRIPWERAGSLLVFERDWFQGSGTQGVTIELPSGAVAVQDADNGGALSMREGQADLLGYEGCRLTVICLGGLGGVALRGWIGIGAEEAQNRFLLIAQSSGAPAAITLDCCLEQGRIVWRSARSVELL